MVCRSRMQSFNFAQAVYIAFSSFRVKNTLRGLAVHSDGTLCIKTWDGFLPKTPSKTVCTPTHSLGLDLRTSCLYHCKTLLPFTILKKCIDSVDKCIQA